MFEMTMSVDVLEQALAADEAEIARRRAHQMEVLRALDTAQVAAMDGSRTMAEWTAARLDMEPEGARILVEASKRLADRPALEQALGSGEVTLDRAVATARLVDAGAGEVEIARSFGFDLAGVRRLVARRRRMTPRDEQAVFRDRFVAMQPTLDNSSWRLWGQLPGLEGRILEEALARRGDDLPAPPGDERPGRSRRNADALASIAMDSLDGPIGGDGAALPAWPVQATVFVDGALAAATGGEAGVEIGSGLRGGPGLLDEILCGGVVDVTGVSADGTVVAVGGRRRAIPPRIRRYVLWRDGGCTIDGCTSRYRLQPHHIIPWSQGGTHHPDNLTTLCWFHHHVVIHGEGRRLDPASPPQRRRFLPPTLPRPPPG